MNNREYKKIINKLKLIEELKLDLLEIQAYRELQDKPFVFYKTLVKNDSNKSEDAMYKVREANIRKKIYNLENQKG